MESKTDSESELVMGRWEEDEMEDEAKVNKATFRVSSTLSVYGRNR